MAAKIGIQRLAFQMLTSMPMTSGNGPLSVLVMAEINELRSAEANLARTLVSLPEHQDEVSKLSFLSSLAEVKERAYRLERVLDAMAGCGYGRTEGRQVRRTNLANN